MRRDSVSTLVSLLILGVVVYMFKDQLKGIFTGFGVGSTTKGTAALGAPTAPVAFVRGADGSSFGEIVPGLGYIPQSELNKNPNSPSGGLGISGSD